MEMGKIIYSILKRELCIIWSWGIHSFKAIDNGLMFKVEGFKHKGYVTVTYNEGADLFEVAILTSKMETKNLVTGIYYDQLVEIIDNEVEKVSDYEKRVKQEYSLL